jgi:crossover junction endodeoxyribonuclease RuvC
MSVILGIDPGSHITGFGLVQVIGNQCHHLGSGCIRIKNGALGERLYQVYESISDIIQQYSPQQAAVEKVFMHENPDSALKLGQARGAAFVAIAASKIPAAEYTPRMIKKAVVGYGAAEKNQIQHMVKLLLCLSELPQKDAADALAVALCHASYWRCGKGQ